jgi:hypothetical protein
MKSLPIHQHQLSSPNTTNSILQGAWHGTQSHLIENKVPLPQSPTSQMTAFALDQRTTQM